MAHSDKSSPSPQEDAAKPRTKPSQMAPLALTMGEPGGVGGELALKAWQALSDTGPCFFVIDDPERLKLLSAGLGLNISISAIGAPEDAKETFKHSLPVLPIGESVNSQLGKADSQNAHHVINAIERSVALALSGAASGVVTNPIQKASLISAGFKFPGHTEFLAHLTADAPMPAAMAKTIAGASTRGPVMLLAGRDLMAAPATIHLALREAIKTLNEDLIVRLSAVMAASLSFDFNIAAPRLAISGLNPHAGEDGAMGHEDKEIIAPAVEKLKAAGVNARGPLPADTLFHEEARQNYDAALCMYHDQALIPVKALDFHGAVNITLGLPIIRTSPDHGTALDIAGLDIAPEKRANPASLIAAIRRAGEIAVNRQQKTVQPAPKANLK